MKIAHVASSLSLQGAGVQAVVSALARAQARAGHEVHAIGLEDDAWQKGERGDWSMVETTVCARRGPRALGYAPGMTSALAALAPDIVHLHGLWMHPGRSVLQWHQRSGCPYILSVHGMLSGVALRYSPIKKRIVRAWFQDCVFDRAALLHATQTAERDEFRNFGLKQPVAVISNGVDILTRPSDLAQPASRSVLSLGRIHPKKGLDILIEAWAGLEYAFPNWSLRIVGPDESNHRAELEAQTRRLGLKRVVFQGAVYGPARNSVLAQADIFALPTRSENFALTVAESLMLEVPVISSKGAPWADLEDKCCGRWVDLSAEAFSEALRQMMSLPAQTRRAMGQRGRDWMLCEFTWAGIADAFVDLYGWAALGHAQPATLDAGQRKEK